MTRDAALVMEGVSKRFGGTVALKDVSLTLEPGQVVGLVGENGSGKSTLMNVLAGRVVPDSGTVRFGGVELPPGDLRARVRANVGVVFQDPTVCPDLEVSENILLGRPPARRGWFRWRQLREEAQAAVDASGLRLPVRKRLRDLSQDEAHLTDVVRLLARGTRVLVFDETTASLTADFVERLFRIIETAKADGVACVFISHRLDEVFRICDRVVVLRDGALVMDTPAAATSESEVIRHMVGRELSGRTRRQSVDRGETVLDVQELRSGVIQEPLSLQVRAGQVVGIGGLVGSGRSTVLEAIYGLRPRTGQVTVSGRSLSARNVRRAVAGGVGFVPEDRRNDGLAMEMSILSNATLVEAAGQPMLRFVSRRKDQQVVAAMRTELGLKAPNDGAPVRTLSGGNQQKIVLGRWLARQPKVLLLDEPTRGIDVGAKAEIYSLIDELAASGMAILLVTSELEELLTLSDEIIVLREGRVTARLGEDATEDAIAVAMAGTVHHPA
jgi:L-arabinose transport system ATP-binding protein